MGCGSLGHRVLLPKLPHISSSNPSKLFPENIFRNKTGSGKKNSGIIYCE